MTTAEPRPVAVLLMALGGPDSLESVEPYLLDVRGGRPTPPELVEEIRERYRVTGGRSPVLEITVELAGKLEAALNRPGLPPFRTFVCLRHWHPRIAQAWADVVAADPQRVVAICMAPQYSSMTVGKYLEKLDEARHDLGRSSGGSDIPITTVGSWARHPRLIDALVETVLAGLDRFPEEDRPAVTVLFTAHSLPERILASGDPYPDEVRATVDAVAAWLPEGTPTRFAFQSQGRSAEPWLGPAVETVLDELAA
ncbi:MAG TPA: ferrochelatase, partial [Acidimicrobiia bacterium]|nr:ferrochelatase [Acidimicrobiia bacterium]